MHLALPLPLVLLLLLALPASAEAILYITQDQVVSTDLQDSAQIGHASASDQAARLHPASPTVTVTASGRLPGSGTTNRGTGVYNASVLNLNGGYVAGIGLTDDATANVTGGTFGSLSVSKNATLNPSGGSTASALGSRSLSVNDQGTVQMTGGYVNGSLETYHVVLQPSGLVLWASPMISLANGTIADDVLARSRSRFTSSRFHIGGDLEATQESHVDGELTIIAGAVRSPTRAGSPSRMVKCWGTSRCREERSPRSTSWRSEASHARTGEAGSSPICCVSPATRSSEADSSR